MFIIIELPKVIVLVISKCYNLPNLVKTIDPFCIVTAAMTSSILAFKCPSS